MLTSGFVFPLIELVMVSHYLSIVIYFLIHVAETASISYLIVFNIKDTT